MALNKDMIESKARWVRIETLRLHKECPATRVASSLSCVELLCCLYYGGFLRFDPQNPAWEKRDRFLVSKGHGSIALYPVLADLGFFDLSELGRIGHAGGLLKAMPDTLIPGYETINGSLGHGLSVACGIAWLLKRRNSDSSVFVLCGDGELTEGAMWEAIMFAAHHRLDNLTLVVDDNKRCMLGYTADFVNMEPLSERFSAFGWESSVVDGHNIDAICVELTNMRSRFHQKPKVLVANTVKGKGVRRLELDPLCHVKSLAPDEVDKLILELS